MSIFGKRLEKRNGDIETLTMHVRDLHKRVKPINDLEQRITALQQELHNTRGALLTEINNQTDKYNGLQDSVKPVHDLEQRITDVLQELHNTRGALQIEINNQTDRYNGLQNRFQELNIKHYLLKNSITDKRVITLSAETKGGLEKGELFSFGNGGRSGGYVCMFPGKILGMGLYSDRKYGDVNVAIIVNGKETQGYDTTITRPSGHDNFSKPLSVEAGDVVNFICKSYNAGALNTIASLIIELLID